MFVLDASVVLTAMLGQTRAEAADAIIARVSDQGALVPAHWTLELANALAREVKNRRLSAASAASLAAEPANWSILVDDATHGAALGATLALAIERRLSSYDAAYLELCLRRELPLATFDAELASVAASLGVGVISAD
jgi:predicted nucleic acid-binding protein